MGTVRLDPWPTLLTRILCFALPAVVIYPVTLSNYVPTAVNRVPCQQDMRNGVLKELQKMDYVACVERIRGGNGEGEVWTSGCVEETFHMQRSCMFKHIPDIQFTLY